MSEWKCYKLNEISSLSNGINFDKSAYTSGVKLIGVSDFKNRIHPDYDSLQEVDSKVVKSGDYLEKGDIVFVRSNGNKELVGRCMMIDRDIPVTYSGFCIKLRLKDKKIFDPVFFNYLFKTRQFKKSMTGTAVGANIQNLSQSRLGSCEVNVPDIETQKEIATILSRYDSLIENYQKQIKLLEEAAQRLYKEWFVDLHFPGHENTKIVDGVPEGWEKKNVTDIIDVKYGKDHKLLKDGEIPVYGTGGIMRYADCSLYTGESVLIPRKGSLNNIMFVDETFWTIDTMFYSIPKIENAAKIVYFYLKGLDMYSMNIGAAVPSMTISILSGMNVLLPTNEIRLSFEGIITKYFDEIKELSSQIRLLTESRDRLLPKLMSGEITV